MAKKEKIQIQRDKRLEPIDNDLDAAMGLLDDANKQITDLLASMDPLPETPATEMAAELPDAGSKEEPPEKEAKSAEPKAPKTDSGAS